eukprot:TRINITY_DN3185_c0_g1_i1.p1 TRINITY_DN3185_c0_g1~~TRINITY_DN3185_c0_g1_i1.p1  ORF type:complete len:152 (+),score=16.18 TRINITY_DN3185_c0_g1_i1:21-476(+)
MEEESLVCYFSFDVWAHISDYLSHNDLYHLLLTSKGIYEALICYDHFWSILIPPDSRGHFMSLDEERKDTARKYISSRRSVFKGYISRLNGRHCSMIETDDSEFGVIARCQQSYIEIQGSQHLLAGLVLFSIDRKVFIGYHGGLSVKEIER